jgi:hypothetical protein
VSIDIGYSIFCYWSVLGVAFVVRQRSLFIYLRHVHVYRWDKPRLPGERRRRIIREQDRPDAPPDPPPSGYVVFVCQMTAKIRHDRPSVQHNQSKGTC